MFVNAVDISVIIYLRDTRKYRSSYADYLCNLEN